MLKIFNKTKYKISLANRLTLKKIYRKTLEMVEFKGRIFYELNIVTNDEIKEVNKNWRNKDIETDVIAFELHPMNFGKFNFIGECYLSIEKANEQSKSYQHSFKRELCFLFIHGLLHSLGFDHEKSTEDEKKMFDLQDKVLEGLGICR